jgi:SAM-dependent methyltransferase
MLLDSREERRGEVPSWQHLSTRLRALVGQINVSADHVHREGLAANLQPSPAFKQTAPCLIGIERWRSSMASNPRRNVPAFRKSDIPSVAQQSFPVRFIDCMTAYKQGAALKGAIELDLFTILAEGGQPAESLALRLQAATRGVRILCDYLTIEGFLLKENGQYSVTQDTAMFLNRESPAYIGSAAFFLGNPMLMDNFRDLAECVRKGGTVNAEGTLAPEHPIWVEFARSMAPVAAMDAELVARLVSTDNMRKCKVLDIAAGHGMYGIALARHNPHAQVVALDWKNVLPIAEENAKAAGVSNRYRTIEGSSFDVAFGGGYDIVLLTGFLHHFNTDTNEALLRKVHSSLNPGGRAVVLEFIPNEDRITPRIPTEFSLTMLATTPHGDAYTFRELDGIFRSAGFTSVELHEIPPSPQRVVIGSK